MRRCGGALSLSKGIPARDPHGLALILDALRSGADAPTSPVPRPRGMGAWGGARIVEAAIGGRVHRGTETMAANVPA